MPQRRPSHRRRCCHRQRLHRRSKTAIPDAGVHVPVAVKSCDCRTPPGDTAAHLSPKACALSAVSTQPLVPIGIRASRVLNPHTSPLVVSGEVEPPPGGTAQVASSRRYLVVPEPAGVSGVTPEA